MVEEKLISEAWLLLKNFIKECFCEEAFSYIEKEFRILLHSSIRGWTRVMLYPNLVYEALLKNSKKMRIVGGGILAGWLWGGKFIPSPYLYNFIYETFQKMGCAISAKPQGVKAFLYGNDLLLASLDKVLPPIKKGECIAIVDSEDLKVIGIGILLYDEPEIAELIKQGQMLTAIVKNVFDLGVHIRDERFFT